MKKILLVSMMHNMTDLLKEAEPDLKGKTVVYIPTAAIAERDRRNGGRGDEDAGGSGADC